MGWWGYGIMEGDTPSDVISMIEEAIFKGKRRGLNEQKAHAIMLHHETVDRMIASEEAITNCALGSDEGHIYWQVAGMCLMSHGADITRVKDKIVAAASVDDSNDFNRPEARKTSVNAFLAQVNAYDNKTPVEFDTIAELTSGLSNTDK